MKECVMKPKYINVGEHRITKVNEWVLFLNSSIFMNCTIITTIKKINFI